MLNVHNKKPINIGILDVSSQSRAILEFFFNDSGKPFFRQADFEDSAAFLFDHDYPGAKQKWEELFNSSKKPGIVLSAREVNLPFTVWVEKPFSAESLIQASKKIHEFIENGFEETPETEAPEIQLADTQTNEIIIESKESIAVIKKEETVAAKPELAFTTVLNSESDLDFQPTSSEIETKSDDVFKETFSAAKVVNDKSDSQNLIDNREEVEIFSSEQTENEQFETTEAGITANTFSFNTALNLITANSDTTESCKIMEMTLSSEVQITEEEIIPQENSDIDALLASLLTDETNNIEGDKQEPSTGAETKSISSLHEEETQGNVQSEVKTPVADFSTQEIDILDTDNLEKEEVDNDLVDPSDELSPDTDSADRELQLILDEIREEVEHKNQQNFDRSSPLFPKGSNVPVTHKATLAEKRWALICGNHDAVSNAKEIDSISFSLSDHMLSILLDTVEQSKKNEKVLRLKFKHFIIVVDHASDFIYCNESIFTNKYADVCYETLSQNEVRVHELDASEIRLYRQKDKIENKKSHPVESFIWTTSLLTSRGRLLKHTDINKKIGLKNWPNLTRVEQVPHAMQIAAVFFKHPGSLKDVSNWLKIDQRYVFSFYNAALSLNLIELDDDKIRSASLDIKSMVTQTQTQNRGFFSRLMKRIKS